MSWRFAPAAACATSVLVVAACGAGSFSEERRIDSDDDAWAEAVSLTAEDLGTG